MVWRAEYAHEAQVQRAWKAIDMAALSGRARVLRRRGDAAGSAAAQRDAREKVIAPLIAGKLRIQLSFAVAMMRAPMARLAAPLCAAVSCVAG